MKNFRKITALLIALVMVFAMAVPAFANAETDGHIKISGLNEGDKVTVYRVATIDDNGVITPATGVTIGNAATDSLNAEGPTSDQIEALIRDEKGTKVFDKVAVGSDGVFEQTNIPYGIYVAKIEANNAEGAATKTIYNPVLMTTYLKGTELICGEIKMGEAMYAYDQPATAKKTTTTSYKEIKDGVTPDNSGDAVDTNDEDETLPLANQGPAKGEGMKTVNNRDSVITYRIVVDKPEYPANAQNKSMYVKDILTTGVDYCDADRTDISWEDVTVNGWEMQEVNGKYFFYSDAPTNAKLAAELIPGADGKSFEIVFDYDLVPDKFEVIYYGRLNADCAIGHEPNTNTMEFYYTQDVTQGGTWKPGQNKPAGDYAKITDSEDVYTYRVELIKKIAGTEDILAGATFKLQKKVGEEWVDVAGESGLVSGPDGVVKTNCTVEKGTYRFVETAAPAGYSLNTTPSDPIEATWVAANKKRSETNFTTEITEAKDYDATKDPQAKQVGWIKDGMFYETQPDGVLYDGNNGDVAEVFPAYLKSVTTYYEEITNPSTTNPAGINIGTFNNTSTAQLPSTGGMGTYIFTIVGVSLLAVASFMLIFKRRKAEK